MPSVAEQLVALDRRIAYLEKSAEDLRQQMAGLDKATPQHLRLNDLLAMGERTLATLRTQREELARQGGG